MIIIGHMPFMLPNRIRAPKETYQSGIITNW